MSVSRNGVYKIYDHMHVAFPRIIPRIMPPNHTRESYLRNIPPDQQGRAKHTPKHTPETYLRNIPRIIPPDATRFAGHGVFGKGHIGVPNAISFFWTWYLLPGHILLIRNISECLKNPCVPALFQSEFSCPEVFLEKLGSLKHCSEWN